MNQHKILVLNDTQEIIDELVSLLTKLFPQHKIHGFTETEKAIDKVKESGTKIEICIFNSLSNQTKTGFDFARICRQLSPDIMLIYNTNSSAYRNIFKKIGLLAEIGIDGYIHAPFTEEKLKFWIINAISRMQSFEHLKSKKYQELEKAADYIITTFKRTIELTEPREKTNFWKRIVTWIKTLNLKFWVTK